VNSLMVWDTPARQAVDRLVEASIGGYYNPYKTFEWPDSVDTGVPWMSAHLMTTHGSEAGAELTDEQRLAVSRWESLHFYSLNVHGIRELLMEVMRRIHKPGFEVPTPYFHHFIGEENEHMWFFAEFCLRYGGKLYPDRSVPFPQHDSSPALGNFIVFSRILVFEQIVDYFNSAMAADESLPETIRAINRIHHQDESRHIAFGGQLVHKLFEALQAEAERTEDSTELDLAKGYVSKYVQHSVRQLYSTDAYRDAGIPEPNRFRTRLLDGPSFEPFFSRVAARTVSYYKRIGLEIT
jgi:hypothetical protein